MNTTTQTNPYNVNMFMLMQKLSGLNKEQYEAASIINGRVLVIAGAGSGKTLALTTRIANMVAHNINPANIFSVTFTNKAAKEMKERLAGIIGKKNTDSVWMGTFHSQCVKILRKHGHLLGYGQKDGRCNFAIYDTGDTLEIIKRIFESMKIEKIKPGYALHYIDEAKNNLWSSDYCLLHQAENSREETMAIVYERYQELMKEANAMDFGDLIMNVVTLLEEYPEARDYWQGQFTHVLCDEYQDTNPAQFELLKLLARPHMNLFCVGDPDQSIYAFRGSDIKIIMDFERHFSPCTVIKLERNYRSTEVIVEAGNSLISNNPQPYDKVLKAHTDGGDKIDVVTLKDEYAEAAFVGAKIKQMVMSGKYEWKDFAILYRTGFQAMTFEMLFINNLIPFKILGGTNFFEREEIKDITSYLRVIASRKDDVAMLRIMNKPARAIGKVTQDAIKEYANKHGVSIYRAMRTADNIDGIKKGAAGKVKAFLDTLDHLEEKTKSNMSMPRYAQYVLEQSGLMKLYRDREDKEKDGHERIENLEEFIKLVGHYELENPNNTLEVFLQEMALSSDYKTEDDGNGEPNMVKLLTMHSSKGLEFPVVFGVGMNEKIFPSWRSNTPQDLQEERRLAYVMITRAEKKLFLTSTEKRASPNGKGVQTYESSRFIDELSEELVNKMSLA